MTMDNQCVTEQDPDSEFDNIWLVGEPSMRKPLPDTVTIPTQH